MSELRRFFVDGDGRHEPASEYEDEHACLDGDWVRAVDVEELEQERDALKAKCDRIRTIALNIRAPMTTQDGVAAGIQMILDTLTEGSE